MELSSFQHYSMRNWEVELPESARSAAKTDAARGSVEVDSFLLDDQRLMHDSGVNIHDVFTQKADED